MTLPQERANAVLRTRQFLVRLSTPYDGGIKGVRREVRQEARDLLRHYPGIYEIGAASNALPEIFGLQSE